MTEGLIKDYLRKPYDRDLVDTLRLYLMNDYEYYRSSVLPCVSYAKRRVQKGDFNKYLFVQNVKLTIDRALNNVRFRKVYYDLPKSISLSVRYQVARKIVNYILEDFLGKKDRV